MKTALECFDAMLARWREDREPPSYRDLAVLREAMTAVTGAAAQAAMRTLTHLGYTYHGAEQWTPPLGTRPVFERPPGAAPEPRVVRADNPPNQYVIEGAPAIDEKLDRMLHEMRLMHWRDQDGIGHSCTIEWGTEQLKRLSNEWPGGIDEMIETTRGLRRADAKLGEFERLLDDIGIVRENELLFLEVRDGRNSLPIAEFRPDSAAAKLLTAWMMRKQAALHGERRPGQAEAAAALMTAPDAEVAPEWIDWDGAPFTISDPSGAAVHIYRGCPVRWQATVRIRFRDGEEREFTRANEMRWAWTRPYVAAADIVAYKIIDDSIPF